MTELRNDRHLTHGRPRRRGSTTATIDTVVVAFTDMQGRLQGKRLHGRYFADVVVEHGTEGCNYLLAVDVDMNTVGGYAISSWERGYGDMEFVLDERTIRLLTHLPATAMVQCDLVWLDHSPVVQSPRTHPAAQLDRLRRAGLGRRWPAPSSSSSPSTRPTRRPPTRRYRDLTPVNQYNVDYSILGTTRVEPLLRAIRNTMYDAGLDVEGAKGECNFGQHEIGFLYADALTTADNHVVYKTVAKEIAAQQGKSITFMAKYNEREGSSCHIHLSLRGTDGVAGVLGRRQQDAHAALRPLRRRRAGHGRGLHAALRAEHQLLQAVRGRLVRADRRSPGARTTAPARSGWSATAPGARMENRVPGADVNPYLALAAMLAGGLHGIEQELPLEAELVGNAYDSDKPQVPAHDGRGPRAVRRLRARPRGASATRSSTTTPTWPTSSSRRTAPRSPTGSCAGGSSGCDATRRFTVVNPATEQPVVDVPADRPGRHRRRDRAPPTRRSRPGATWRPGERATLLRRFAAVVDAHIEELAELEVRNSGHTWGNARWEAGNVRDCLNYYSGAPERLFGRQIPVAGGTDVTFHEPLGVVGVIVPWNFPMPIAGWGFAPALAAGNTVVLKPAELTPLTAIRLGELALEAGLPEHVLTVLPGQGLGGRRAVRDPRAGPQGRASPARPRSASGSWPAAPTR